MYATLFYNWILRALNLGWYWFKYLIYSIKCNF